MHETTFDHLDDLPVHAKKQEILQAVANNQVTIITAETGAGKSTQVPQFLAEAGYTKVVVTQPRILAARNLSGRVQQEYSYRTSTDATSLVGYRTAHERDDAPENVILYCTDGLQLVRELTGAGTSQKQILVLDEVHEWNENMEVLVAWAKKRCAEDPDFKVVLMSATIETESLATYFGTPAVISIEGRSFPVEKRMGDDVVSAIIELLGSRNCNMLVFLPGKAEIETVAEAIAPYVKNVPIIRLHSQLEPELQQQAFASFPQGKVILSTNIAQTSVTIDDIDAVIDSGLERRAEVRSGVEGLFIEQVSQADCMQRAGRAGRTKEGLYILAGLPGLPCLPLEQRPEYGIPEIMRKHIDRLVLRLANIDIDIEALDFYHSPSRKTIKFAKQTLKSLGALTPDARVTAIGREMERFPLESSYARMLVEAKSQTPALQSKLAAIIAIQEVGGIIKGGPRYSGWRKYTRQLSSDLVAQYDVYLALPALELASEEAEEIGIITKNVTKAQETMERLNHDLGIADNPLSPIDDEEMPALLKCIVAGQLHQLWAVEDENKAVQLGTRAERELSSTSVVKHASLVAGTPFDLEIAGRKGLETLHLVNQLTAVDPLWLKELAPELFTIQSGKVYYDSSYGILATRTTIGYGRDTFNTASSPRLERTSENRRLFIRLYSIWIHEQLEKERRQLQGYNRRNLPEISLKQVEHQVEYMTDGAVSLAELPKEQRLQMRKLTKPETYYGPTFMATLNGESKASKHKHFGRRPFKFHRKNRRDRDARE
jgi:ATP-dependent RNA helicase DHX8/PRP22